MTELEKLKQEYEALKIVVESTAKQFFELGKKIREYKEPASKWFIGSDYKVYSYDVCETPPANTPFNTFSSMAEAEKELDIRQVWLELRAFAKKWNASFVAEVGRTYSSDKYNLFYNHLGTLAAEKHFGDKLKLLDFI